MEYISDCWPVCNADVSNVSPANLLFRGCPECKSCFVTTEDFKKKMLLRCKKENKDEG